MAAGNQAVARLIGGDGRSLPQAPIDAADRKAIRREPAILQREVVKIGGGERLEIADGLSNKERKEAIAEAKAIIKEIEKVYGVSISSSTSVKAILKDYFPGQKAPKEIREVIEAAPWRIDELKNVRTALQYYAPLLGKRRKGATDPAISGTKQKITSIGKVGKALSPDDSEPFGVEVETSTLGESFSSSKNITFFEALSTGDKNFRGDNPRQQRGTMAHELCHAMVQPEHIGSFVSTFADYWQDEGTRIADPNRVSTATPPAEAPISMYGATNAGEDLAETAKFYFEAPDRLKGGDGQPKGTPGNPAPRRYEFFNRIVLSWTNSPEQVSKQVYKELAEDFLKFNSNDTQEIIKQNMKLSDEFKKIPEDEQKSLKALKSAVSSHYVDLVMAAN